MDFSLCVIASLFVSSNQFQFQGNIKYQCGKNMSKIKQATFQTSEFRRLISNTLWLVQEGEYENQIVGTIVADEPYPTYKILVIRFLKR